VVARLAEVGVPKPERVRFQETEARPLVVAVDEDLLAGTAGVDEPQAGAGTKHPLEDGECILPRTEGFATEWRLRVDAESAIIQKTQALLRTDDVRHVGMLDLYGEERTPHWDSELHLLKHRRRRARETAVFDRSKMRTPVRRVDGGHVMNRDDSVAANVVSGQTV